LLKKNDFTAKPQGVQRKTILFSAERAEKRIDRIFSLSVLSTEREKYSAYSAS
jgi:hypothetical protein